MSRPTIAAVMPVYNRARLVVEALDSIAAQSQPPDSLIIVDDGSTDESYATVARWIAAAKLAFPARLVRQEHAGVATATNHAARLAEDAHFLAVLDSDDLWPADHLQRLSAAMAQRPDAVAASCDILNWDYETGETELWDMRPWQGLCHRVMFTVGCPIPSATLVRASAFRAAGGCDTRLWCRVDRDLYLRLCLRGPWLHVPGAPIRYRRRTQKQFGGAVDLTRDIDSVEQKLVTTLVMERFILKYGGRDRIPAYLWRSRLSREWCTMALAMQHVQRPDGVLRCLALALWYKPYDLRVAVRLVRKWIRIRFLGGLRPGRVPA